MTPRFVVWCTPRIRLDFRPNPSIVIVRGAGFVRWRHGPACMMCGPWGGASAGMTRCDRWSTTMKKKSDAQKSEPASVAIVIKPARAAKSKRALAIGTGTKKTVPQSKSDRVLSLLKQTNGATLDELMTATKWQAHSVRGFLSGAVKKRKGLTVLSECDGEGARRYRIVVGAGA